MRLDQYLVQSKNIESRTKAQDLIINKNVFVNNQLITKPSHIISTNDIVEIRNQELIKYVSRAGLKLEAALIKIGAELKNKTILDIGQSTGGFTDCCLSFGADTVVGIDVGENQLHEKIRSNPKVRFFEKLNIKNINDNTNFHKCVPNQGFDFIVCDVSFISLTHVIPNVFKFLKAGAEFLFLVKPQFECGPENLDKNGIVKNKKIYIEIQNNITQLVKAELGQVLDYFESALPGKEGNAEFFIYGRRVK